MQETNPNASYDIVTGKISFVVAGGPAHRDYRATYSLHIVYQQPARQKLPQAKAASLF